MLAFWTENYKLKWNVKESKANYFNSNITLNFLSAVF